MVFISFNGEFLYYSFFDNILQGTPNMVGIAKSIISRLGPEYPDAIIAFVSYIKMMVPNIPDSAIKYIPLTKKTNDVVVENIIY